MKFLAETPVPLDQDEMLDALDGQTVVMYFPDGGGMSAGLRVQSYNPQGTKEMKCTVLAVCNRVVGARWAQISSGPSAPGQGYTWERYLTRDGVKSLVPNDDVRSHAEWKLIVSSE